MLGGLSVVVCVCEAAHDWTFLLSSCLFGPQFDNWGERSLVLGRYLRDSSSCSGRQLAESGEVHNHFINVSRFSQGVWPSHSGWDGASY
eukprot:3809990-Amphidinium_carterae.1